jgi:peptide/nickel transport system permease protein
MATLFPQQTLEVDSRREFINRTGKLKFKKVRAEAIILIAFVAFALLLPLWQRILGFDPYFGDVLALNLESEAEPLGRFGGISFDHPLGIEPQTGRDVLLRLSQGIRTSIGIALAAAILSAVIGTAVGVVSGYFGGWIDNLLNRITEIILSIPLIFFALAAVPVMQTFLILGDGSATNLQRIPILIFILSLFGWPEIARVIRSEVKVLKGADFVSSARISGGNAKYITRIHLLPHIWTPVAVISLTNLISFIKVEASLSLLGSGVIEPLSSWGTMIALTPQYIVTSPTYVAIVGLSLLIFVYVLTRFADRIIREIRREPSSFPD